MPVTVLEAERFAAMAIEGIKPAIVQWMRLYAKRQEGIILAAVKLESGWFNVAQVTFGDPKDWEHEYDNFAYAKMVTVQTKGCSTREALEQEPGLHVGEIEVFVGGVIDGDVAFAFSGVEGFHDELFSLWGLAGYKAQVERDQLAQAA